jgi:amino acid adenylation domain-containing protein
VSEASINRHTGPAEFRGTGLSDVKRRLLEQYRSGSSTKRTLVHDPHRTLGRSLPLSFPQEQVWLHGRMAGDVPFYNETMTVYRHGPLDTAVLERCLLEIIRRYEIWRTTFDAVAGEPVQIVQPPPSTFSVPVVDLRGLPHAERETEAERLAAADARRPFDLAAGPLLRVLVIRFDDERYRIYVTVHQIIFDAVTAYRVFLPELTQLYGAFASGKPSPLPEPVHQYGDFAYWQRKVAPESWPEHAAYWREQMAGPPTLQWPNDRPRPAAQTHRGAIQRYVLPANLIPDLRSLGQRNETSLYMVLLAAFAALLHRYTGQDDLVIGTFTAGRKLAELEPLLGYFVNPLALRIDFSGDPTFAELLARVRTVVLDALKHEDLPFSVVVKESRCKLDASRNPLFQVVLSQQPKLAHIDPGWDLATEEISNGGSKLDLMIVVDDRGDRVYGPITYNPDIFDAATITRVVEHWQTLLAAAAADPQMRIADLPLLTPQERRKVLVEWNDTKTDFPAQACLHHLIEAQVERTPGAIAVIYEQERLTYRELDLHANQLAHHLRRLGVGPGVRVGICLERSAQMTVGLLGILKAGGAYVPLDPEYPKERLAFMIKDSGLEFLVTQGSLAHLLADYQGKLIHIDRDWALISQESRQSPSAPVEPEHLAYVIYTSGSTGKPKGVQICHRALVNFLTSMQARPGLTGNDRMLAVTTISFDIAALELYLPLTVGACCVIASRDRATDGRQLSTMLGDHDITVMQATPSTWKLLLDSGWRGRPGLKILCGGEAMSRDLARELITRASSVWNMYGPTETTVWSAIHAVALPEGPVPIGRPIANTQIYVLDRNLQPVPMGASGELYIGGEGLAQGYLGRPELDAEKFIRSPFTCDSMARLYRTGDLARYRADGNLEYLGRTDTQVKVRGFRIELEEIECVLRDHPGVGGACVNVREDTPGDLRLIAYVTPLQHPASINEIRSLLKRRLPSQMVPILVALDKFPLTPNGKVDRRALPPPDSTGPALEEPFVGPRSAVEEAIAGVWTRVLGLERVSTYDNFFDLGGHSLLAMRVIAGLESELGLRINPKELMFQTLGQLAAACEERLCSRATAPS